MNSRQFWVIAIVVVLLAAAGLWFYLAPDQTPPPVVPVESAPLVTQATPVKSVPIAVAPSPPQPPASALQLGSAKPTAPQSAPASKVASHYPGFGPQDVVPTSFPPISPEQKSAITQNLRQLFSAAQQYMLDKSQVSVRYRDLVGDGTDFQLHTVTPVAGEDYSDITISQTTTEIPIVTPSGDTVLYNQYNQ